MRDIVKATLCFALVFGMVLLCGCDKKESEKPASADRVAEVVEEVKVSFEIDINNVNDENDFKKALDKNWVTEGENVNQTRIKNIIVDDDFQMLLLTPDNTVDSIKIIVKLTGNIFWTFFVVPGLIIISIVIVCINLIRNSVDIKLIIRKKRK